MSQPVRFFASKCFLGEWYSFFAAYSFEEAERYSKSVFPYGAFPLEEISREQVDMEWLTCVGLEKQDRLPLMEIKLQIQGWLFDEELE